METAFDRSPRGRPRRKPEPPVVEGEVARIPLIYGGWVVVDAADAAFVGQWCWRRHEPRKGHPYAVRRRFRNEGPGPADISLHVALMEPGPGLVVDHRDGDGLNCRRSNMRVCTQGENLKNKRARKRDLPKGVCLVRGRYLATIMSDGVVHRLGLFSDVNEAAAAYREAALRLHGEFARVE